MDIFPNIMSTYINKIKNNIDVAGGTTLYSEIEISITSRNTRLSYSRA